MMRKRNKKKRKDSGKSFIKILRNSNKVEFKISLKML